LREIEQQIDPVCRAAIPNWPAYISNSEETKELLRQLNELIEKRYIHESMSLCAVPVLNKPWAIANKIKIKPISISLILS
jgi:hypothetical protein